MVSVPYAAHGYGAYFCLSLMDAKWKPNLTLEEAKGLLQECIDELKRRFIVNLPMFSVRLINSEGISEVVL